MKNYVYKEPFNGTIENSMTNGIMDYTGEEIRTETIENNCKVIKYSYINGLTFEEYQEQKGTPLKIATSEELQKLWENYEKSFDNKPFEEITQNQWEYSLECLPPVKYTRFGRKDSFFFISEAYTGDLHSLYVEKNGKFYTALRNIKTPAKDIINSINKLIK